MKRIAILFAAIAMMAGHAQDASAQLGSLLKKAKKTVESVGGVAKKVPEAIVQAKETPIPSGGTMINPVSKVADIELVGAYGKSTSANYGEVYFVFKVKMIANKSEIKFGGMVDNVKAIAVDQDGNTYNTDGPGWYPKQVTEGMAVKVVVDESSTRFKDVKKTVTTMQLMRLGVFVDLQNKGVLTFKNVPIKWDEEPE